MGGWVGGEGRGHITDLDAAGGGANVAGGTVHTVAQVVNPEVDKELFRGGFDGGLGHGHAFPGGLGDHDVQFG